MRSSISHSVDVIKAGASGLSLTLTVSGGVGILCTLMTNYDQIVPGGVAKVSSLTRWFMSVPHHPVPVGLAAGLMLIGSTWMAAQDKQKSLAIIHSMALAFVSVGVFACSLPYRNIWPILRGETPAAWAEYLWLIPSSLPLLIAVIKHRRNARICPPS